MVAGAGPGKEVTVFLAPVPNAPANSGMLAGKVSWHVPPKATVELTARMEEASTTIAVTSLITSGRPLDLADTIPRNGWTVLEVPILGQEQTAWCWAAVAMSLALFFKHTEGPFKSQATLARAFVGHGVDCTRTVPGPAGRPILDPAVEEVCNVPFEIDRVLAKLVGEGNVEGRWETEDNQSDFEDIRERLDAKMPVPCAFRVHGGQPDVPQSALHYFLITGYRASSGVEQLRVIDPLYCGGAVTTLAELRTSLSGRAGSWDRTYYLTRPA